MLIIYTAYDFTPNGTKEVLTTKNNYLKQMYNTKISKHYFTSKRYYLLNRAIISSRFAIDSWSHPNMNISQYQT